MGVERTLEIEEALEGKVEEARAHHLCHQDLFCVTYA